MDAYRHEFARLEYSTLRREIDGHVQETLRLEQYVGVTAAALYGWLATAEHLWGSLVWFVPVALSILGAIRSLALYHQVNVLAGYLLGLETELYDDQHLTQGGKLGWEAHYQQEAMKMWRRRRFWTSVAVWVFLIIGTIAFPILMSAGRVTPTAPAVSITVQ